jgi:hypothetical protein
VDRLGDEVAKARKNLDTVVERGEAAAKEEEERRENARKTNEEVQKLRQGMEKAQEERK